MQPERIERCCQLGFGYALLRLYKAEVWVGNWRAQLSFEGNGKFFSG